MASEDKDISSMLGFFEKEKNKTYTTLHYRKKEKK